MDEEFDSGTPIRGRDNTRRSVSTSRVSSRNQRDLDDSVKKQLRNELNLTREFIDFDVIKGSAFFHTKPANHDRKLVQEGFERALFLPFDYTFWSQKPWFYEIATLLYISELISIILYIGFHKQMSVMSTFEVVFPLTLLLILAIGYGRVSSMLQSGDHANPNVKIYSPSSGLSGPNLPDEKTAATSSFPSSGIAHVVNTVVDASTVDDDRELEAIGSSFTPAMSLLGRDGTMDETRRRASSSVQAEEGLDDKIAESENSDSTDSDDENNNSSSSSDETHAEVRTRSLIIRANAPIRANTLLENKIRPKTLPTVHTDVEPGDRRRLAVCVWEDGIPVKRLMSINELRATILTKVKATSPRRLYRKIARAAAVIVSLVPVCFRVFLQCQEVDCFDYVFDPLEPISLLKLRSISGFQQLEHNLFAQIFIAISCMLATYFMASIMFAALADAEVTYHRRFLYAKCFTALTSARRSRLSNLPHFRLKNVVNIKAWIALRGGRTWLKRQGRQRAADEIVSSSFLLNLVLLVVMGVQSVSEFSGGLLSQSLIHIEVTVWCSLTSVFMLRFMMLGSRINKKYQNTSLLLTEQMNVYLRLLAKPHKKEKLLVSNNVLKLASKLLKELNSPNKVSGLTMNPLLYNLTRVVVLSAFSSVASEVFGFKLKLWKMKV